MELRVTAEHMQTAAEYMEGFAWLGMGVGFWQTVRLGQELWRKRRTKGRKRNREGESRKKKIKGSSCCIGALLILTCTGGGFFSEPVRVYGEETEEHIHIEGSEPPNGEKDDIWYYNRPCDIRIMNNEEVSGREEIRCSVMVENASGEWETLSEEEMKEWGITCREQKEGWKIFLEKEIRCRVRGEVWKEEEEEKEKVLSEYVMQEVIIDQTRPKVREWGMYSSETGEKLEEKDGWCFAGNTLRAEITLEEKNGIEHILCRELDGDSGACIMERKAEEEGRRAGIEISQDFRGKIVWTIVDLAGNTLVWEQPEKICTESEEKHQEHSSMNIEKVGEDEEGICLRLQAADEWSGIRRVWLRKMDQVIMEEWMDQNSGSIHSWEKILELPFYGMDHIPVSLEFEDMAGHWGRKEIVLEREQSDSGTDGEETDEQENGTEIQEETEDKADPEDGEEQVQPPWMQDTEKPGIRISGVEDGKSYSGQVSFAAIMEDPWLDMEKSECILWGEHRGRLLVSKTEDGIFTWEAGKGREQDDVYHLIARAFDLAGNCTEVQVKFLINRKGSTYFVEGLEKRKVFNGQPQLVLKEKNKSEVLKRTLMCVWEGETKILEENADYTVVSEKEGGSSIYTYRINPSLFEREGRYTIHITSTDQAGNKRSNLNYYDQNDYKCSFPIEFYVTCEKGTVQLEQMERGIFYFRKQETAEPQGVSGNGQSEVSKKEEQVSGNGELGWRTLAESGSNQMVSREMRTGTEFQKKGNRENKGTEEKSKKEEKERKQTGILWSWLLILGMAVAAKRN